MNKRLSSIEKNDYMWKLEIGMLLDLVAEDLNNEDTLGNVTKSRMIKINEEEVRNAIRATERSSCSLAGAPDPPL